MQGESVTGATLIILPAAVCRKRMGISFAGTIILWRSR